MRQIDPAALTIEVDAYVRGESEPTSVALERYAGRWIVLFFSPRDFTLRVLQALRTGKLCPASWRPGRPTLTGILVPA